MGLNASTDNRSAERSPSGKPQRGKRGGNRGRKPPRHRIAEHARDRTELWHRGERARARERSGGIPLRTQVRALTEELELVFVALRDLQAGAIPSVPRQPETMREENTRRRKARRRHWRGE
jgi:hypothetical protein